MSLTIDGHKVLNICVIFLVTFTLVLSEYVDYLIPIYDEFGDYNKYHFRISDHHDQIRLDPKNFFMAIYNPDYRRLPHPYQTSYEVYTQHIQQNSHRVNFDDLIRKQLQATYNESCRKRDFRYLYPSADHNLKTRTRLYQSKIYKTEKAVAMKYIDECDVLPFKEYKRVMMKYLILPKLYEDYDSFSEARLLVALFLRKTTPGVMTTVTSTNQLVKIPQQRFLDLQSISLLKEDTYWSYSVRLAYYEYVPLHADQCNAFYDTNFQRGCSDILDVEFEDYED